MSNQQNDIILEDKKEAIEILEEGASNGEISFEYAQEEILSIYDNLLEA